MIDKNDLIDYCHRFVANRMVRIQDNISGVQESLQSETKSSAGDKHETGRAMLQLEREKLGQQLSEAEKMKAVLNKVNINNEPTSVALGSLVKTSKASYFIAISAGEFKAGEDAVFCISVGTPIGRLLLGKSVGDSILFNENQFEILSIK
ncbi:transcription elongation GreA/GreB family factor [Flavobacteriaceae bacterium MAR_2009_75]|nr:transcription elongation GreA/GreB family factor [Flavobacteriaceae bacterium MAR_2009_75]